MAKIKKLTTGYDMGKLGDYSFYMKKNEYKKISQSFTATFGSFKPINGQERLSDSGGYSRTISLNGVLVVQPLDALKTLEDYLKARELIRFTSLFKNIDINVVITSLNITQSNFIDTVDGVKATVQTYNISLKEVYDDIL
jgi:hypothetical protein